MGSSYTVTTERRALIAFRVVVCALLAALVVIGLLSLRVERAEYAATQTLLERTDLLRETAAFSGAATTNTLAAILVELRSAHAVPPPKPKPKHARLVPAPCPCGCPK